MLRKLVFGFLSASILGIASIVVPAPVVAATGYDKCPSVDPSMQRYCYSFEGYRWPSVASLSYKIDDSIDTPDMRVDYRAAVNEAARLWNALGTKVRLHAFDIRYDIAPDITFVRVYKLLTEPMSNFCTGLGGNIDWSVTEAHTCPYNTSGAFAGRGYVDSVVVRVNAAQQSGSLDEATNAMAHELGHVFGLRHVDRDASYQLWANDCNYTTLMAKRTSYRCASMPGGPGSCSPVQSPLSGQLGPGRDEAAAIAALYGASATPLVVAVCRPSLGGRLVDYTNVNLRTTPSTGTVVAVLPVGTYFWVYDMTRDSSGRTWAHVRVPSLHVEGYIASWFAAFGGSAMTTTGVGVWASPTYDAATVGTLPASVKFDLAYGCDNSSQTTGECATAMGRSYSWPDSSDRTWFHTAASNGAFGWVPSWLTKPWSQ